MSKVIAFTPSTKYIPVSITGTYCSLNCLNCGGKYLRTMVPAITPHKLYQFILKHWERGGYGVLLSGGFNSEGYLPLNEEYLRVIKNIRNKTNLVLSIHLGLAPKHLVDKLYEVGIDFIDFEIPPSDNYLKYVKGLHRYGISDYLNLFEYMLSYRHDFAIPHIILGNKFNSLKDEINTLLSIINLKPELITFLIEAHLYTDWKNLFNRVRRVIKLARKVFVNEIALGCMRPFKFKNLIDDYLISKGYVDRIASPRIALIKKHNLKVIKLCCSVPRRYLNKFLS